MFGRSFKKQQVGKFDPIAAGGSVNRPYLILSLVLDLQNKNGMIASAPLRIASENGG